MDTSVVMENLNWLDLKPLYKQHAISANSSIPEIIKQIQRINPLYFFYDTSIIWSFLIDKQYLAKLIFDSSSTFKIIRQIQRISQIYNLYDTGSVEQFLIKKKQLVDLLELIYVEVKSLFISSNLYIKVLADSDEGYEGLIVEIDTHLDIDEAILNLDKIIDWFVCSVPDDKRKHVTITLK